MITNEEILRRASLKPIRTLEDLKLLSKYYKSKTLIKTVVQLPALLYHEICHFLMSWILLIPVFKIKCEYFYRFDEKERILYSYCFSVSDNSRTYFGSILTSIAPTIGYFILPFISFWFIPYMIICFRQFWLSENDIYKIKKRLKAIKNKQNAKTRNR